MGIFGIIGEEKTNVASSVYYGLFALQHRGQESCGIVVNDDGVFTSKRDTGLVNDVFDHNDLAALGQGNMAIGHVRYGTLGTRGRENAEPIIVNHMKGRLALAESLGIKVINPAKCDANKEFADFTDGNGFDVVYEASGSRAGILMTTDVCKIRGTIVPLSLAGVPVEFVLGKVSFKELSVIGSRVYTFEHFKAGVKMLEEIASRIDLRPLISDIIPLADAKDAIDMMKSGKNKGKILIKCD